MQHILFCTQIYQHVGKCDDQQNLKDILDAAMVSTTEGATYNSSHVPMTPKPVKKPSDNKSLCLFTNILNVKKNTAKCRVGAEESKRISTKVGKILWTNKIKLKRHKKPMIRSNKICMHG